MEYPRADKAVIVDAETGGRREVAAGETEMALYYEMTDMEQALREGNAAAMQCDFTRDVMAMMTKVRKDWGMQYPGEEW